MELIERVPSSFQPVSTRFGPTVAGDFGADFLIVFARVIQNMAFKMGDFFWVPHLLLTGHFNVGIWASLIFIMRVVTGLMKSSR